MISSLKPDFFVDSIYEIDDKWLEQNKIRALIVDVDNTMLARDVAIPHSKLREWVVNLRDSGIELIVVSNNWTARVRKIAEELDLPLLAPAGKPLRLVFSRAIDMLGSDRGETAIVGDQLFTDVLGGRRAKILTILVAPVSEVDLIHTKMLRVLEKVLLRRLSKKVLIKGEWRETSAVK
ncbi:MAG TPA: YqeG family HAD IIIA-type phosphatase [Actinobacteria bacterium]|nr:YqeG family HAD IIIA-type phosphatase [Actinomycetota bacterium]